MEASIIAPVLVAAAIHPLRDLLLKGNPNAESGYFAIVAIWLVIAATQVLAFGEDLTTAAGVWIEILFSTSGLVAYYFGILYAMRAGAFSVYYPIIRSAPVFMVFAGWLVLGQTYTAPVLIGVAVVTAGVWLIQYRPGSKLLDAPATLVFALLAMSGMGTQSLADAEAMQHVAAPVLLFWQYLLVLFASGMILLAGRPHGRAPATVLFAGWRTTPGRFVLVGSTSYLSYYLILTAYERGGDAVAVGCLRQASIPLSVVLGGLVLREIQIPHRFGWSLVLVAGIVLIIVSK